MTCEPTQLQCRRQGALLPDTRVTFTEDDVVVDPSTHTGWQVEAATIGSTGNVWATAKTAGITTSSTEVVIAWAADDLGALHPGDWELEVTGTFAGRPRKGVLQITIDPEIS